MGKRGALPLLEGNPGLWWLGDLHIITQLVSGKAGPGLPWLHKDQNPQNCRAPSLLGTWVRACTPITKSTGNYDSVMVLKYLHIPCYSSLQEVEMNSPPREDGLDLMTHFQQTEQGRSGGFVPSKTRSEKVLWLPTWLLSPASLTLGEATVW